MADRLTIAHINLADYAYNLAEIRQIVGDTVQIMTILKANAYGHGIERMAQAAIDTGVSYLGVVSLGELRRIRRAGIDTAALIINHIDAESLPEVMNEHGAITVMDR